MIHNVELILMWYCCTFQIFEMSKALVFLCVIGIAVAPTPEKKPGGKSSELCSSQYVYLLLELL